MAVGDLFTFDFRPERLDGRDGPRNLGSRCVLNSAGETAAKILRLTQVPGDTSGKEQETRVESRQAIQGNIATGFTTTTSKYPPFTTGAIRQRVKPSITNRNTAEFNFRKIAA